MPASFLGLVLSPLKLKKRERAAINRFVIPLPLAFNLSKDSTLVVLRRLELGHLENLKTLESIVRNGSKSYSSSFFVWPNSDTTVVESARLQKERLFHLPRLYVSPE